MATVRHLTMFLLLQNVNANQHTTNAPSNISTTTAMQHWTLSHNYVDRFMQCLSTTIHTYN